MTDTEHMQITIGSATYQVPLHPLGEPAPGVRDLSFSGSGPAKFRLPIFANGSWFEVHLSEAK